MKLLIAVDSAISTEVLVGAVGVRPWPDGTTAHVLSVVADRDVPEEVWREEGYGKGAVRREMERRGEEITPAVESFKQVGIPAELEATGAALSGNAKEVILEEARKWDADLIVVGSHGRRGFKRFLLGSVSEAVAMNAHCSVVVVRRPARHARKAGK